MTDALFDDAPSYVPGKVTRARNGRPYILADPDWHGVGDWPEGFIKRSVEPRGFSKLYTRTTTYISCLEDTYSLGQWQERQVALGLAMSPPLVAAAQRVDVDNEEAAKAALNDIAAKAKDVAGWKDKADLGTDFHEIAHEYDKGRRSWRNLGETSKKMLAAYLAETDGWEFGHVEQGVVNDELGYFGTPDRLTWVRCEECFREMGTASNGRRVLSVDDIKTGRIDYGQQKMALQMAAYAIAKLYDADTGIRTELPICLHYARILHVPYGEGTCTVYRVPLKDAITALTTLVPAVRAFRSKTKWFEAPSRGSELSSGLASSWPAQSPEAL